MRALSAAVLFMATTSLAKPWQGIEPGESGRDDVIAKFGEPTKVLTLQGKEVLAYMGTRAIKGTQQAQFRIDVSTQRVERIDVFPESTIKIDKDAIENSYGKECPPEQPATSTCYVKKLGEDFSTYLLYPRLGLSVFFDREGKNVASLTFTSPKGAAKALKAP
jgi:hypothetical protein